MAFAEKVVSVSELNKYVSLLITNDARLKSLKVGGELTGFKRHSSGHIYFSLKDENALIRCVMFKSYTDQLSFAPEDGMQVVLSGKVSLYEKEGQYQFYATGIRLAGEGELYKRFIELRDKLEKEGLFARKRSLPFLPRCIGVATSETGAAFQDIKSVISRRFPTMRIVLAPVQVQGAGAAQSIIDGIERLNSIEEVDVIIVGRGGGSYEDLFCFNDEALARAIFASEKPVVSAVGHEIDYTICDFVADLRAPTPSAAAELCVPEFEVLRGTLQNMRERMNTVVFSQLSAAKQRIKLLSTDSLLAKPAMVIEMKREKLNASKKLLEQKTGEAIMAACMRTESLEKRLEALNPYSVLKRGYAMVTNCDGKTVYEASELKAGDSISLKFADGTICASVSETKTTNE